jgi:hypothetical protein
MAVRCTTPKAKIRNIFNQHKQRCYEALMRTLMYCGEQIVNRVRDGSKAKSYRDQTGNLRSSTGYILVYNGKVVSKSNFASVLNGGEGSKKGETFAKELADKYDKGFALIVVAGMEYAVYVEDKGYDVLMSGEILAENIIPRMLKQLKIE